MMVDAEAIGKTIAFKFLVLTLLLQLRLGIRSASVTFCYCKISFKGAKSKVYTLLSSSSTRQVRNVKLPR